MNADLLHCESWKKDELEKKKFIAFNNKYSVTNVNNEFRKQIEMPEIKTCQA
jgi:hypothetical protein